MRNGWGDEFTKKLRRRIIELKRESKVADREGRPIEALTKKITANELEIQLSEYCRWRGYAKTGKNRGPATAGPVSQAVMLSVRDEA